MKKILFLSKTSEDFNLNRRDFAFISDSLMKENFEVDVYDIKKGTLFNLNWKRKTTYKIFPKNNKYFNILFFFLFLLKNQNKYDIVQINYVREEYLIFSKLVKGLGNQLIIFVYGCDFNLRTKLKDLFYNLYNYADLILFTSPSLLNKFDSKYKKLNLTSKLRTITLPFDHFKFYENFTVDNKDESKDKLGIPHFKKVLAIGTSSSDVEQHEIIIENISKLGRKENYFLIFNLSDKLNENNLRVNSLIQLIESKLNDFDYKIFTGFITYEEMAMQRHATDIYINLRKRDQFVLAMLESNLAYSQVITGDWLPYEDYIKETQVITIPKIDDLKSEIEKLVNVSKEESINKLQINKDYVLKHFNISDSLNEILKIYNN